MSLFQTQSSIAALWLTLSTLAISGLSFGPAVAAAELRLADPIVLEALRATDTPGLPRNLTPGERPHLQLRDLRDVPRVPPLADDLYTAAEYERNESILMRWGNFNSVLTEMIVPITTGDSLARVLLVVASNAQQNSAASTLNSAGANLDRVDFLIAPSDSIWIRDYGPRFTSADNERVIIDHEYNRPRPQDNQIPAAVANDLDEELFTMPVNHGGGNFHLFASGEAYMTNLIVDENPGLTDEDVIDLYAQYQGVDLTLLPALPAQFDSTQHLDMWFLPVDDQTVIIGDYATPPPGVNPSPLTDTVIDVTEFTADLMVERGYTVLRTPGWRAQGFGTAHHTYTNAVIVNDLVLICSFDGFPNQDAEAATVFEQAFPGKTVVAVDCSAIIDQAGALHCIVKHKPSAAVRLSLEQPTVSACLPDEGSEELTVGVDLQGINGFSGPVTLATSGEPSGVASQFDPALPEAPGDATWILTIDPGATGGVSSINLSASDGLPTVLNLDLQTAPTTPGLLSPSDLADDVELLPLFEWTEQAGADSYRFQLATDSTFDQPVVDQTFAEPQLQIEQPLAENRRYHWRVMALNACSEGEWSSAFQFRTGPLPPEFRLFDDRFESKPAN